MTMYCKCCNSDNIRRTMRETILGLGQRPADRAWAECDNCGTIGLADIMLTQTQQGEVIRAPGAIPMKGPDLPLGAAYNGLKPCPFCGVVLPLVHNDFDDLIYYHPRDYDECPMDGYTFVRTAAGRIAAWNRRAPVTVSREDVERAARLAARDSNPGGGYLNADQTSQAVSEALPAYRRITAVITAALNIKVEDSSHE